MRKPVRSPHLPAGLRDPLARVFGTGCLLCLLGGCGEGLFGSGFGPRDFGSGGSYSVISGDTVYGISRKTGVPVRTIIETNALRPPYLLRVGQSLDLSGSMSPRGPAVRNARPGPAVAQQANTHVVAPGETAFSVARRHGVRVADLAAVNSLDERYTVRAGETLRIPGRASSGFTPAGRPMEPSDTGASSRPRPGAPWATASVEPVQTPPRVSPPREAAPVSAPPARSGVFLWPVNGPVLLGFGQVATKVHNDGLNIEASPGTPVRASENGVVAYAGNEIRGYGNLLLVKHDNDFMTAYAHLDTWAVTRGETVRKGQEIARVGSTGGVTRPQLHFEIRKGGKAVDPLPFLEGRNTTRGRSPATTNRASSP